MIDRTTRTAPFAPLARAIALACSVVALAACGPEQDPEGAAGHATIEHSSAGLPDGRVAAGEQVANAKGAATGQSCIDCHGIDGNAPIDASYPKLGGQYATYIAHALQAYRSGDREHALMSSQARGLSDQQIADLAVYFASRPAQLHDLKGVHDK